MPSIAAALAATSESVVEVPAGDIRLQWRVRRVNTADLVQQGLATLLRAASPEVFVEALRGVAGKQLDPVQAMTFLFDAADKDKLAEGAVSKERQKLALVCAGLQAVRRWVPTGDGPEDGSWTDWETLTLTFKPEQRNPDAGVLLVDRDLPPAVVDRLYTEIRALSTDGGLAGERLASFLGGP